MQVTLNAQGYITGYALIGGLTDGIEIPTPKDEDLEHFKKNFKAYTLNGFDANYAETVKKQELQEQYRQRREKECFPIINRGILWFNQLTAEQQAELQTWYIDWLNVTDTMIVPTAPVWLK